MKSVYGWARQSDLTSECWSIQLFGPEHCEECEFKDTDECGGRRIRETGENSKGVEVPIGELHSP